MLREGWCCSVPGRGVGRRGRREEEVRMRGKATAPTLFPIAMFLESHGWGERGFLQPRAKPVQSELFPGCLLSAVPFTHHRTSES